MIFGVVLRLVLLVLTWLAYFNISKKSEKGWQIFLLVIGIIWLLGSLLSLSAFLVITLKPLVLIQSLFQLVGSICFILTFALKSKES
ncbi:hypothetical protein [Pseudolactococcus hodotermopsidis]|uniref:hypothetical protein n=1 Tax=Pseudolactococcus hodotermopsidis TaxID=2709157 RepID=UPI001E3D746E|nr:hypothetical protein [Lactococcus hodotermopsidis]